VEWKVVAAAVEFVTAVLSSPARQGDEKNSNQKYNANAMWFWFGLLSRPGDGIGL